MRKANFNRIHNSLKSDEGFTLIELLVVVSIIGLLSSIMLVSLNAARAKARDAKRLGDVRQLATALEFYYASNASYPPVTDPSGPGGWETTLGNYLPGLVSGGFISTKPADPLNRIVASGINLFIHQGNYYYAYYNYPASYAATYGCSFNSAFSVIGIKELEGGIKPDYSKATCGTPPPGGCTGGGIVNVCRDWSTEFDVSYLVAP